MALDRRTLPSIVYWNTKGRGPQRFYVAFCLLMSSIQDALLGIKEREQKNLNWSATCSYYSLVHVGRLLSFLTLGDYLMRHEVLAKFLSGMSDRQPQSDKGYPFDWLDKFDTTEPGPPGDPKPKNRLSDLRSVAVAYLEEIGLSEPSNKLDVFGKIITIACKLRNDCNYEALLIAHEYEHPEVSPSFEELAHNFEKATTVFALPLAMDIFNGFVSHDRDLAGDRPAYAGWVSALVGGHLFRGVKSKLCRLPEIEQKLKEIVGVLQPAQWSGHHAYLADATLWDNFGGKKGLMETFGKKILELRRALES